MPPTSSTPAREDRFSPYRQSIESDLANWLAEADTPDSLVEAMRYVCVGGKRIRPTLVLLAAKACGGSTDDELTRRAAVAIELIHIYSLVHDDLPAMDDDCLRRGRETAHVKFGEPMAILVGDALLTRAFGLIAQANTPRTGALVKELAAGAGMAGMVGGQVADMALCTVPDGVEGLDYIHRRKTAALLRTACRLGAHASGAPAETIDAMGDFGESIGLAFQVIDDLLDATGTAEQLGKTPGKDAETGKRTHLTLLGKSKAQALGEELTARALDALTPLGEAATPLRDLAQLLTRRDH